MEKEMLLIFTGLSFAIFDSINSVLVIALNIVALTAKDPQQKQTQKGEQVSSSWGLEQVELIEDKPPFFSKHGTSVQGMHEIKRI